MTKQQIREEFERLGLEINDTLIEEIHHYANHPMTPLQSIFEPMMHGWQRHFDPGDTVMLIRPFFGVPLMAIGKITAIEYGFHIDTGRPKEDWELNASFLKGRPLTVKFDLSPFKIPFPDTLREQTRKYAGVELPDYWQSTITDVSPNDVVILESEKL